ncbi:MAG: hypothetical protein OER04_11030 [Cyclobacteriaceae bacterium]|nr:hypothetical protein [Cyclobacteriaceae bacterium]
MLGGTSQLWAQNPPSESHYYSIATVAVPEGIHLEVGGITTLEDGRVALCTRRGDVWIIENAAAQEGTKPRFVKFASGLHEPLGLTWKQGALYTAQRGELTKLVDTNGDDRADVYETIYAWPLSGHYHEYSFGPKLDAQGNFFVTGNVAFGNQEWWRGESRVPWRGWTMKIHADGTLEPWATGMRSPCGLGMFQGQLFYADNQGDWMGSGGIWHLKKGSFTGHPAGLRWTGEPNSPLDITTEQLYARVDPRQQKQAGQYVKPENIRDEEAPVFLYQLKDQFPNLQLPAVWLPHGVLGISNSEILEDQTEGKFGPFGGQLFVGDQGQSKIMRVVLEKIKGEYQGVAFDFRSGFQSGVLRMSWGHDGSLFVGETNRGWGSAGPKTSGLQRLIWNGKVPMEMKTVQARVDGFEIEFTHPVDVKTAEDLNSYGGMSYIYKYHPVYGSPPVDQQELKIRGVKVSDDRLKVRVVIDNLRKYYVHELRLPGIKSAYGLPLLHSRAYYTLNNIPDGEKLSLSALSTKRSSVNSRGIPKQKSIPNKSPRSKGPVVTYGEIEPLLVSNTCIACHQVDKPLVGPSYQDIAKRKYTIERMVELIYNPQPKNWPEYATPMAPMPQVPRNEALKIANWINTLD